MPDWWRELPDRDCEYVTYYPVNIRPLNGGDLRASVTDSRFGFGMYIHVPLCDQLCPFCNYNKFPVGGHVPQLVSALIDEIHLVRSFVDPAVRALDFVYFGGGTPSVLRPDQVNALLQAIRDGFTTERAEIALECHPNHGTVDRLTGYREAGVNRVSFGIQSLNDAILQRIGSYHTRDTAIHVVDNARTAGYDNVAFDLMFLLPGQDLDEWRRDLAEAMTLHADHISTYRLALDPLGRLGQQIRTRAAPKQADETTELAMARLAIETLGDHGYRHYGSCSSGGFDFAVAGRESRYEMFHRAAPQCEYAAVGPGAVGHMNGYVYWNIHTLHEYEQVVKSGRLPTLAGRKLTSSDRKSRYAVLGVKHLALPTRPFEEMFGVSFSTEFARAISLLEQYDVAHLELDSLRVTAKGVHYMDNISKAFYDADNYRMPQPYKPELQVMSVELHGA